MHNWIFVFLLSWKSRHLLSYWCQFQKCHKSVLDLCFDVRSRNCGSIPKTCKCWSQTKSKHCKTEVDAKSYLFPRNYWHWYQVAKGNQFFSVECHWVYWQCSITDLMLRCYPTQNNLHLFYLFCFIFFCFFFVFGDRVSLCCFGDCLGTC